MGPVPLEELATGDAPPVEERLGQSLRDYWLGRVALHFRDSYAGIPMQKFPEDLRVYEHLLWDARADTVIEIGVHYGSSQLWFRDRLRTMGSYDRIGAARVIGVDLDLTLPRARLAAADPSWADEIELVEGSIEDDDTIARIRAAIPDGARCFIVEDSAHEYGTTAASLRGLADLTAPGSYFVVEDGCVDVEGMRLAPDWPRGVLPAVADWLATAEGSAFRRRRDLELYGITCHPGGFLQRRPA
jgi:cephalosporin hydroxylase